MIALRRVVTLVEKELAHHAASLLGFSILMGSFLILGFTTALFTESSSLLEAARGFVYFGMPVVTALVVRRLVVLEHEESTWDFLSALPVPAWARVGVKYLLGLGWCVGAAVAAVWATALLVFRQELLSFAWLVQLSVQSGAYVFAWYALVFAIAHLGRFRLSAWLALLVALVAAWDWWPDVSTWGTWHAALARPLDETRHAVPVREIAVTIGWGIAATAVGWALATFRAGVVTHEWFRPLRGRERSFLMAGVLGLVVAVEVLDEALQPRRPEWGDVPALGGCDATVRVVGPPDASVWDVGERLCAALDGLREPLEISEWPTVVLVSTRHPAHPAEPRRVEQGELVLEVDPDLDPLDQVRLALRQVLAARLGLAPLYRGETWWVLTGAPAWWLADPDERDTLAARAALAGRAGLSEAALADGHQLLAEIGPDEAEGAAWAGLVTLEELVGRERVLAAVRAAVGGALPPSLIGLVWYDHGRARPLDAAGVDPGAFRAAWRAALEGHASASAVRMPSWGTLGRTADEHADVTLRVDWPAEGLEPGLQVRWTALDPLQDVPQPEARFEWAEVLDPTDPVPTQVDPRARVAAGFCLRVDAARGMACSPLRVLP